MNTLPLTEFTPVLNPAELLARVDPKVFELYRKGAELHVWRNSSPHNWWLSKPGKSHDDLHNFEERTRPEQAYFAFGRKLEVSTQRVSYGGWMRGSDEGLPVSEAWAYDEATYQALCRRWELAIDCAVGFNALAGTLAMNPRELDLWERKLIRAIKRGDRVPMLPGNAQSIETLCRMSLVQVSPEGYAVATELLKNTVIPSEATMMKESAERAVVAAQPVNEELVAA